MNGAGISTSGGAKTEAGSGTENVIYDPDVFVDFASRTSIDLKKDQASDDARLEKMPLYRAWEAAFKQMPDSPKRRPPAPRSTRRREAARRGHRGSLTRQSRSRDQRRTHALARKRIQPADVIAWSLWRRAHQAAAQKSHLKQKSQL
jgi:hypothetical protein